MSINCHYYQTDSDTSARFKHHRFYDFRSLDARYQLHSNAFTDDWSIQTWGTAPAPSRPVRMQRIAQNVNIRHEKAKDSNSYLSLRASRTKDSYNTAEIEFKQQNILHASIRVRARVRGAAGACAGIFTYRDDSCESDIEMLTSDPTNRIHYTNQPGTDSNGEEMPDASTNMTLPGGARWTDWNDHRLDWTPETSAWYVNGALATTKTYSIPKKASSVILNMWGDGGSWTGDMDVGASADLQVQWIEMVFNTTDIVPRSNKFTSQRDVVCLVDKVRRGRR
ncbi:hypothetical protein N7468_002396 [Penicillium chermesinum]|uniref:GH16 domain-containing protein n=1 Tax=Penicillium chermesinum TaxID=63820 RepID=A0A9W9PIF6_9EURO|nr:uncharacterized protein N7468_002396 [Penicillium chermesinum]KAJ5247413.1 hypothetical protein N7468_002396 [Penicillium chermesinum]KAJ6145652.1 hypothetical protein N7470_009547 [Penicillium chermesinum]